MSASTTAPSTARERLVSIARVLADSSAPGCSDVLVHVLDDPSEVVLGIHQLDPHQHPCEELRDLVAPPEWWAVGIVIAGRARYLDRPDAEPERVTTTYLVERGGATASLVRRGDVVTAMQEPMVGRIPDLCRSMLGLP